jgi:hypothetical protein
MLRRYKEQRADATFSGAESVDEPGNFREGRDLEDAEALLTELWPVVGDGCTGLRVSDTLSGNREL